jgi:hypothetical protein
MSALDVDEGGYRGELVKHRPFYPLPNFENDSNIYVRTKRSRVV